MLQGIAGLVKKYGVDEIGQILAEAAETGGDDLNDLVDTGRDDEPVVARVKRKRMMLSKAREVIQLEQPEDIKDEIIKDEKQKDEDKGDPEGKLNSLKASDKGKSDAS